MGPEVVVVATGTANLASVLAGLVRAGARPRLATSPADVDLAAAVVLPGVGALQAAMERLNEQGMVPVLQERVRRGQPTLAVCLGLQLLAEGSEESPGVRGLGLFAGIATCYPDTVRVPQMGWNRIKCDDGCRTLQDGWVYFANSYRLQTAPEGWSAAWSDHAGPFVAALERGPVLACQFHPELSGPVGRELLLRWVGKARQGGV